jgi:hypothetical protein
MNLKVPQIFLHHVGHCHAQGSREILRCHGLLFRWILQQLNKAIGKTLRAARREKVDGEFLAQRHLAEIREIGANNRYAIGAGKMRNPAASGGGGIWHDCNRR